MDNDGSPELIIGKDGYINYVYTLKDGATSEIYGAFAGADMAYLTEDNYLVNTSSILGKTVNRYFQKVVNGERVTEDFVCYNPYIYPENESPWQRGSSEMDSTPISEEEFLQIFNSKDDRVVLDMLPLIDYPAENAELKIGRVVSHYGTDDSYNDKIRETIINPPELEPGVYTEAQYALIDLDGDGQDELYLDEGYYQGVYTLDEEGVRILCADNEVTLCQGNIVEVVLSYTGNNKTYCYYKIENGKTVPVDYLRYDEDRNPENPWFRSSDASGQDISLVAISEAEASSIRGAYAPLNLEMKPITEYPLNGY